MANRYARAALAGVKRHTARTALTASSGTLTCEISAEDSAPPSIARTRSARIDRSTRLFKPAASTVLFCSVLAAGLLLRLLAIRSLLAQQNSDTSIVYLMARHVAHGEYAPALLVSC